MCIVSSPVSNFLSSCSVRSVLCYGYYTWTSLRTVPCHFRSRPAVPSILFRNPPRPSHLRDPLPYPSPHRSAHHQTSTCICLMFPAPIYRPHLPSVVPGFISVLVSFTLAESSVATFRTLYVSSVFHVLAFLSLSRPLYVCSVFPPSSLM